MINDHLLIYLKVKMLFRWVVNMEQEDVILEKYPVYSLVLALVLVLALALALVLVLFVTVKVEGYLYIWGRWVIHDEEGHGQGQGIALKANVLTANDGSMPSMWKGNVVEVTILWVIDQWIMIMTMKA